MFYRPCAGTPSRYDEFLNEPLRYFGVCKMDEVCVFIGMRFRHRVGDTYFFYVLPHLLLGRTVGTPFRDVEFFNEHLLHYLSAQNR